MCRITGFWDPQRKNNAIWQETIMAMRDCMTYGGPDDAGFYLEQKTGLALGHRRLAILDLSPSGHQPMFSSSGHFGLVYNGEVYNYRSIAKELEGRGRTFKGTGDTEVILEAIDEWGIEKAVSRFIGMFALAVWDTQEKVLHLIRDRLGIKPLYYGWVDEAFVFGSELKAFRSHPRCKPSIDREVLGLFFRHNYVPAPYSIYKNIWKLMPGQILTINRTSLETKQLNLSNYWSAAEVIQKGQENPYQGDLEEAREELETLLIDAVRLRLISDVPLGAFLSGGIDSSTVVALMQREANRNVRTFSIGFEQATYNEAPFAKRVAEHLGTDHTELYVTEKEAQGIIPLLPMIYDEPFADSSQIPTYILSKLTRQHVTVSLSGDGGDELFCGYDRYTWGNTIWRMMGWMPLWMKNNLRALLLSVSPSKWDSVFSKLGPWLPAMLGTYRPGDRVHKLAEAFDFNNRTELYYWLISHWREPSALVKGINQEPVTSFNTMEKQLNLKEFIQEMQFLDLTNYLPDDILTKVDRASMAVALEARVPLLDHRLVELAWRLPLKFKLHKGKGKWILRKVLNKYVPEKLIERPKMGFGIPIDAWLRGPLKDWAGELLSEDRLKREGYLIPTEVRTKWQEHLSGKRNWQYLLWDVLMWEAWLEKWGSPGWKSGVEFNRTHIPQSVIHNLQSKKIKVLHLIVGLDPGGAENVLSKLLSHMNPDAFDSLVVTMTDKGIVGKKMESSGVKILPLNMPRGRPTLSGFLKLLKVLKQEKPDILQTWMYHANLLGLIAGKLRSVSKVVWNIRCSNIDFSHYKKLTYWVMKISAWLSSFPTAIIVNSDKGHGFHIDQGYQPKKWEIIFNGFDLENFKIDPLAKKEMRRELGIEEGKILIGLISRFNPIKDHDTFLSAARILNKTNPQVYFLLAGDGVNPENAFFTPYLSDEKLKDKLLLIGFREDIPRILNALDISTSSSSAEGFPNIIGESMACGIPCVVTDVGDSSFLIGETGITVPPGDDSALAAGWAKLIAMEENGRRALGKAARERIARMFSIEKATGQYEEFYRRILSDSNL